MLTLTIPYVAQPDMALPALALLQGAEVVWDVISGDAGQPDLDGVKGADAVRAKLNEKTPAGPSLPQLPSEFTPKTPFPEIAAILDALDDYLAYR